MKASAKTQRLTGLALMTGIIIVLQIVASFIKFGPFTITLALAPIIIGAALYGAGAGAYLGGVFGVVVFIACVAGWDMDPLRRQGRAGRAGRGGGLPCAGTAQPHGRFHPCGHYVSGGEHRHLLPGTGRVLL